MSGRHLIVCAFALGVMTTSGLSQSTSPNGVKTLNPPGAINTAGDTWSVERARAISSLLRGCKVSIRQPTN